MYSKKFFKLNNLLFTLDCFQSQNTNARLPVINNKKKLYVCTKNELDIFNFKEDDTCSRLISNTKYEQKVKCFNITPNDKYLVVCLSDGIIKLVDNLTNTLLQR